MRKPCKECPWVVKSKNNTSIINHAKKHNKTHNCHMITDRPSLWDVKEECICVGSKNNIR